ASRRERRRLWLPEQSRRYDDWLSRHLREVTKRHSMRRRGVVQGGLGALGAIGAKRTSTSRQSPLNRSKMTHLRHRCLVLDGFVRPLPVYLLSLIIPADEPI